MSNVLAIAAVTQLLKDLLNDALINGDVTTALATSTCRPVAPRATSCASRRWRSTCTTC
jgi:hypothetical protein